ncbi:uncharacterized protein E0L32_006062 [Thyridium curvatum]|uniref:Histone deacetylation protein Rxt3 n=1 Tax=Thyridium curvatum TaxID=1093900 RepID=A0A507B954_9PEZI|nr:uncharacterized protein E0L32_006062 [Thyridium curvatum]TPX13591.1 hypothetical protein E0L32_006062 [Thyridium curvatum]
MDPRHQPQPQPPPSHPPSHHHPFSSSRGAASPLFSRSPFPPAATSAPTSSHAPQQQHQPQQPSANRPPYADHQRRLSDTSYYPPSRSYTSDPTSHTPSSHSRHPSSSSLPPSASISRPMPPPGSPPQPGQGPGGHTMGGYGLPPPRPPPVSVGPPSAFPSGRELPALSSLPRTGSSGSSMSISSMLGGPPPPSREPSAPYPPPSTSAGGHGPGYGPPVHASPRLHNTDYPAFRRPHTPDQRPYDARDPRVSANAASPPQAMYGTPEVQRYGTPQGYGQRGPPPMSAADQAREQQARMAASMPPRPNSQPKSFSSGPPPPRHVDMGRPGPPEGVYGRREEYPPSTEYNPERPGRALKYEEPRYMTERERQEREFELRDREMRDRAISGGEQSRPPQAMHQQPEYLQRGQPPAYPRNEREPTWQRPPYEHSRPYDSAGPQPRHPDYPPSSTSNYPGHPTYSQPPADRYPPPGPPPPHQGMPPSGPPPVQPYDSPERQRYGLPPQHQQPPRGRMMDDAPPPPSVAYSAASSLYDASRGRPMEEGPAPPGQPNRLLGIQEMNRKGRISPLPQAVQGAQPQISGPAGEPGIKSEFGRMFAGIGSGVSMGISSPVAAGAQLAFAAGGGARREDGEGPPQDAAPETNAKGQNGRGKRRKLKDEDGKGDDDSTGRLTPVGGRTKRNKTHAHHHHHSHHHHHHHHPEQTSSPGLTPFKNVKGSTPIPSPTGFGKDVAPPHHHHHHHAAPRSTPQTKAPPPQPAPVMPVPKLSISSRTVLDSVANRPRHHLGDCLYETKLKTARHCDPKTGRPPRYPYKTTPKPLPWNLINGKENCTLTVKISKVHLTAAAREEITERRAVWGTDVYTDDSDVIAACIHAGWIRGEWSEDVDVDMLGLDDMEHTAVNGNGKKGNKSSSNEQQPIPEVLTEPPKSGPTPIPVDKDLHVTVLILPVLDKYASTTRFGLRSREWGSAQGRGDPLHKTHDGLSFMVTGIRWVTNGAGAQSRLRGRARRERIRLALREVEVSTDVEPGRFADVVVSESRSVLVRPNPNPRKRAAASISGGGGDGKEGLREGSEGDKENRPVDGAFGSAAPAVAVEPEKAEVVDKTIEKEAEKGDGNVKGAEEVEDEAKKAEQEPKDTSGEKAAELESAAATTTDKNKAVDDKKGDGNREDEPPAATASTTEGTDAPAKDAAPAAEKTEEEQTDVTMKE